MRVRLLLRGNMPLTPDAIAIDPFVTLARRFALESWCHDNLELFNRKLQATSRIHDAGLTCI